MCGLRVEAGTDWDWGLEFTWGLGLRGADFGGTAVDCIGPRSLRLG